MSSLAHLRPLVDARARAGVVHCSVAEARGAIGYDLDAMRRDGFDPAIIEEHKVINERLDSFLSDPVIGEYLTTLSPREIYCASGVRVLPLETIRNEIIPGAGPGGYIFPHGCLVFATSIGGNAICFSSRGGVVWADHDSFTDDLITYKNRTTGEWHSVSFSRDNIELAIVKLADNTPKFLTELLNDELKSSLDSLDLG
jgi:hypothetical protein